MSGVRSSSGGLWSKPTRKNSSAAHTNQFGEPVTRAESQQHHQVAMPSAPVAAAEQRVGDAAAVELAHREQVQRGDEEARPRRRRPSGG